MLENIPGPNTTVYNIQKNSNSEQHFNCFNESTLSSSGLYHKSWWWLQSGRNVDSLKQLKCCSELLFFCVLLKDWVVQTWSILSSLWMPLFLGKESHCSRKISRTFLHFRWDKHVWKRNRSMKCNVNELLRYLNPLVDREISVYTMRQVVCDCHSDVWKRLLTPLFLLIS